LELRGVKCLPFEVIQTKKHSITCSRSFGQTVTDFHDVKEAVLHFLLRATDKLRRHNLSAKYVNVFVSTDRFRPEPVAYYNSKTFKSIYPTDNAFELQERALRTLAEIFREGIEYRRAGIILTGLIPNDKLPGRLFDDDNYQKQINLQNAINEINKKFGRDTVRFGGLERGNWRMKQRFKSPGYTTRISEILAVQ
jgi:DNA polymerase V